MTHLLQHKSWHIWNKDNIARIERDEAAARDKEAAAESRTTQTTQAERLELLRKRARDPGHDEAAEDDVSDADWKVDQHLNLFYLEEKESSRAALTAVNSERAKEEKAVQAKQMRLANTYLGEGAVELADKKPWYWSGQASLTQQDAPRETDAGKDDPQEKRKKSRHNRTLAREDPLSLIKKHARTADPSRRPSRRERQAPPPPTPQTTTTPSAPLSAADKMAKLRAERLARERNEKARVEELTGARRAVEDRPLPAGRYHAQYNPHLVRGNYSSSRGPSGLGRSSASAEDHRRR